MKKHWITLLSTTAILLTLCGCAELETQWNAWFPGEESVAVSEPVAEPIPETSDDTTKAKAAFAIVCGGTFSSYPDRSISGWLLAHFPDGDWSVTPDAIDYFATATVDGEAVEAHFGFVVDVQAKSWVLDICTLGEESFTETELPMMLERLDESE